jgi:NAD(P)-dependent dehydrogenase (short-subunit alcohol dehydrogenase family)
MDSKHPRIAVVTGAARGIGLAIVKRLLKGEWEVAALDKTEVPADELAAKIGYRGSKLTTYTVDVSVESQVQDFFAQLGSSSARISTLVNNCGVCRVAKIEAFTVPQWEEIFDNSVLSAALVCKHASALLGQGSAIVNVGSISGIIGQSNLAIYASAKGAIRALTRVLAVELGPRGIRVNCVCPGYIDSESADQAIREMSVDRETVLRRIRAMHPLRRIGTPEEVANAVTFLASEEASFISGIDLVVDGGYTAV